MWEDKIEQDKAEMTIKYGTCALIVGYIMVYTHTHPEYGYFCFTTSKIITQSHHSVKVIQSLSVLDCFVVSNRNVGTHKKLN